MTIAHHVVLATGVTVDWVTDGFVGPSLFCDAPTDVTGTSATFNGSILPAGLVGDVDFEWTEFEDALWTNPRVVPDVPFQFSGDDLITFSSPTGDVFVEGEMYRVRMKAVTTGSTFYSSPDILFSTLPAVVPDLTCDDPTQLTTFSALFHGSVDPHGLDGEFSFEWTEIDDDWTNPRQVPATGIPFSGRTLIFFDISTGAVFDPDSFYKVRSKAIVAGVLYYSAPDVAFHTEPIPPPLEPDLSCGTPTSIKQQSCTFNASVDPNGLTGTAIIQWTTYADPWLAPNDVGVATPFSGVTLVPLTEPSGNVLPVGSILKTRLKATVGPDDYFSADAPFRTLATPTTATAPPSNVTASSALFLGIVTPKGNAGTWIFQWTTAAGNWTSPAPNDVGSPTAFSGVTPIDVSVQTGDIFAASTSYKYRIKLVVDGVTTFSPIDEPFTTQAVGSPPVMNCLAPNPISYHSCTFKGEILPNGNTGSLQFEYTRTSDTGWLLSEFVPAVPIAYSGTALQSLSTPNLVDLVENRQYKVRIVATDGLGVHTSTETIFNSLDVPALAVTAPTNIQNNSVTLHGSLDPNGSSCAAVFQIALFSDPGFSGTVIDVAITGSPFTGTTTILLTQGSGAVLADDTPYRVRLKGTVGGDLFFSPVDATFTTPPLMSNPTLSATDPPGSITIHSTTFLGGINPNGNSGLVSFEWKKAADPWTLSTQVPIPGSAYSGSSFIPLSQASGNVMQPGTAHHYRVKAVDGLGTHYSNEVLFNTLALPVATCLTPNPINTTSATLLGQIQPNGSSVGVAFQYTTAAGNWTSPAPIEVAVSGSPFSGFLQIGFSAPTGVLIAGASYKVRIKVTVGADAPFFSNEVPFTTPLVVSAPSVTTEAASPIGTTTATLNAQVTVPAGSGMTQVRWKYGTAPSTYSVTTAFVDVSTLAGSYAKLQPIVGLTSGLTYYFIAEVKNSFNGGQVFPASNGEKSFTTQGSTPIGVPSLQTPVVTNLGPTMFYVTGTTDLRNTNASATVTLEWVDKTATPAGLAGGVFNTESFWEVLFPRLYTTNAFHNQQPYGFRLFFLTPDHDIEWRVRVTNGLGTAVTATTVTHTKIPDLTDPQLYPQSVECFTGVVRKDHKGALITAAVHHGGILHWGRFEYGTDPLIESTLTGGTSTKQRIISGKAKSTEIAPSQSNPNGVKAEMLWGGYPRGLTPATTYYYRFRWWNVVEGECLPVRGHFTTSAAADWSATWADSIGKQKPSGEIWTEIPSDLRNGASAPYGKQTPFVFGADVCIPNGAEEQFTIYVTPTSVRTGNWTSGGTPPPWGVNVTYQPPGQSTQVVPVSYGQTFIVDDANGQSAITLAARIARTSDLIRVAYANGWIYSKVNFANGQPPGAWRDEAWWIGPSSVGGFYPITGIRIQAMDSAEPFRWLGFTAGIGLGSVNGIMVKHVEFVTPIPAQEYGISTNTAGGKARMGRIVLNNFSFVTEPNAVGVIPYRGFQGYGVRTHVRWQSAAQFDFRDGTFCASQEHAYYCDSVGEVVGDDTALSCFVRLRIEGEVQPNTNPTQTFKNNGQTPTCYPGHVGETAPRNTTCQMVARGNSVADGASLAGNDASPPSRGTLYFEDCDLQSGNN